MEVLIAATLLLYLHSTALYIAYLISQKDRFHRTGQILLALGLACHSVAVVWNGMKTGHIPAQNLHQTLLLAGGAVTGVFLVFQIRYRLRVLGAFAAPLATVIMAAAFMAPREPARIEGLVNNLWLVAHIVAVFLGEAALAMACGIGILYLIQENAIKTKRPGFFFQRLPSLEHLDAAGYACLVVGFSLLTLGLATGFIYAKAAWGRFLSWDPKEVWSGITWLIYAALLHQRLTVGWRGRRAAIMAIVGFGVIVFTFLGVNFLLQGHHGVFTRW